MTDDALAAVLTALGHASDHVTTIGLRGAPDDVVAERASEYTALITLDLHRQDAEWIAVNEAMLDSTRVIRLRFGGQERTELLDQARALILKWREWELAIENGDARLIIISGAGSKVRALDRESIRETLDARRNG